MSELRLHHHQNATVVVEMDGQSPQICCPWQLSSQCRGLGHIHSDQHLQYLTSMEADTCLNHLFDALRIGGTICVEVPDLDHYARLWLDAEWDESQLRNVDSAARRAFAAFYGWQRGGNPLMADYAPDHDDCHRSGYNARRLAFLLKRIGFVDVAVSLPQPGLLRGEGRKTMNKGERQISPDYRNIRQDHLNRYRFAIHQLADHRPRRILDLACGIGYGSALLARELGAEVVAVDIDDGAIAYARQHYAVPGVHFMQADARQLVLPAGHFDAVVSFETIEHVDFAAELLATFAGLLKPGGMLVASTPNQAVMPFSVERFPFHVRHFTVTEIVSLVAAAGFDVDARYTQPDSLIGEVTAGDDGAFTLLVAHKP